MKSAEIRKSFLDFFASKKHIIVPSASIMPSSPNLLFTNAGMNQFVPYFLGEREAPYPRAADTQKCIRAGGKHNDLEDVGFDTYHHTFFEMLGNWSFGDYFKEDAIHWGWELLTKVWGFPAERLYATVYQPEDGDPADFDQEAYDFWKAIFEAEGLDPAIHIINGNKKDNFWMMGKTGPCGPCSELHVDLTEKGDTKGSLVNMDDSRCIEIWNLVFIQLNANEDGSFRDLPACHVDTGMGFERVCSIIQGSKGMTDFSTLASNYDTDVFTPIFKSLSKLCGEKYTGTVPPDGNRHGLNEQEMIDVAFRVIGDHIRTICFSIADGIEPASKDRNYVVKNILRRAVRFGRILGFSAEKPFLADLAPVIFKEFGDVFPELNNRKDRILKILSDEEKQFNKTLDRGLRLFEQAADEVEKGKKFPPKTVVKLWETFGFPIDLTYLLLDERELTIDEDKVDELVEKHKGTGAKGIKDRIVSAVKIASDASTEFVGYDHDETDAEVLEWIENEDGVFAIVDKSPFYVEKGGQKGDKGELVVGEETVGVLGAYGVGEATALHLDMKPNTDTSTVTLKIDTDRRRNIENHHTGTHLFHWALHEVVDPDASQQGSLVAPDRLRFDFNSAPLSLDQIHEIEAKVNSCIESGDQISISEVKHEEIKDNQDIMQFFGEKYGEKVRVVQIGGKAEKLNGYSMELCGGTHRKSTSDLGFFRIKSEEPNAAGIRRIEAVCGDSALQLIRELAEKNTTELAAVQDKLQKANDKLTTLKKDIVEVKFDNEIPGKLQTHLDADEAAESNGLLNQLIAGKDSIRAAAVKAEKALKKAASGAAASQASDWYEEHLAKVAEKGAGAVFAGVIMDGSPALLQEALNTVKSRQFPGAVAIAVVDEGTIHFGSVVHKDHIKEFKAGDIVRESLAEAGGKGGGKPEMARGAAKDVAKLDAVMDKAKELLGA